MTNAATGVSFYPSLSNGGILVQNNLLNLFNELTDDGFGFHDHSDYHPFLRRARCGYNRNRRNSHTRRRYYSPANSSFSLPFGRPFNA